MSTIEKALERLAEANAKSPPPDDDGDRDEFDHQVRKTSDELDENAVPSSARDALAKEAEDAIEHGDSPSPVTASMPQVDTPVERGGAASLQAPDVDAYVSDEGLPDVSSDALAGLTGDTEPDVPSISLAALDGVATAAGPSFVDEPDSPEVPELDSLPSLGAGALGAGSDVQTVARGASRRVSAEVTIDLGRMRSSGLLTPDAHNSQLSEQLRHIKRPLLMAASDTDRAPNANLIMLASALPNEGKTSTAVNLAMSVAMERDRTVLLIDADVVKSDVSNMLGIHAEIGLTDLLFDPQLTVPDVMLRTSVPKLSVIPSGQHIPNVTELFAGEDMRTLMRDLSQRYPDRIIIIDSPPLLATTGASVLGSLVGQIVLIVEAVRTPQHAVAEALRMLGPLDNIGIVLNKARHRPTYYSTYGYGYDYYSSPT